MNEFSLPVKRRAGFKNEPFVSRVGLQSPGVILCGLLFSDPVLLRVEMGTDGQVKGTEVIDDQVGFDEDVIGIGGGLHGSERGETQFSVWHHGFLPKWIRQFRGAKTEDMSASELYSFAADQSGGMGALLRHSIVEHSKGETNVRRLRDPGALVDVQLIGANLWGLGPTYVFREPYMNSEKRENLRSDLSFHQSFLRDADSNFWFADANSVLMRMGLSDIKPKKTPLKVPDAGELGEGMASPVDGWLYFVAGGNRLMRLRMNPASRVEEMQTIAKTTGAISGLWVRDSSDGQQAEVLFFDTTTKVELKRFASTRQEDPEDLPPVPEVTVLRDFPNQQSLSHLVEVHPGVFCAINAAGTKLVSFKI